MYIKTVKSKLREIEHGKFWIDSMVGMTIGFLATLVVGTIIGLLGINQDNSWSHMINNIKAILSYITPFGIGIGVGYKLKLRPYQMLGVAVCAQIMAQSTMIPSYVESSGSIDWAGKLGIYVLKGEGQNVSFIGTPGDVFAAWLGSVLFSYIIRIFTWHDFAIAIIVIPLWGAAVGIASSMSLTYATSTILVLIQAGIDKTITNNFTLAVVFAPLIGTLMGLALSLPTSSVGISVALKLSGYAATAAIAGTAAQMVTFGVMTYLANKSISKGLTVGIGSAMVQMKNFMTKPSILIIPAITSGVAALFGVALLDLPFGDGENYVAPGMGTSAMYGQIYTIYENGVSSVKAWLNVAIIQIALPIALTIGLYPLFIKFKWLKKDNLLI